MYNFELRPYQREGVDMMLKEKYIICGDEPGLGKTAQALRAINDAKAYPAIIITPASLKINWVDEINKYISTPPKVQVLSSRSSVHKGMDIYVVNYENLRSQSAVFSPDIKALVYDECHFLKNPMSIRSKESYALAKKVRPEYLLLLSGTPIRNDFGEFYPLLKMVTLGKESFYETFTSKFKDHFSFKKTFCGTRNQWVRGKKIVVFEGSKNKKILVKYLKDNFYRRTLGAVKSELPPIVEKDVVVDTKNLSASKFMGELLEMVESNDLAYMTRKAKSAELKAKCTVDYAIDVFDGCRKPVIIFSDHIGSIDLITSLLKSDNKRVSKIYGNTSIKSRDEIIQRFKLNKIDFLVASIEVVGVGLTLTNSNHVIFNDISFVETNNEQARKRIHRIGQDDVSFIHYVLYGPIDRKIRDLVRRKKSSSEGLI